MSEADVVEGELVEDVKAEETVIVQPTLGELLRPRRAVNEEFADYKIRRNVASKKVKEYLQGKVVYKSYEMKPYRKGSEE